MYPTNKSSGLKTATATINNGQAILAGAHIITDGSADATLTVYDNTSAAGTVLFKQVVTGTNDAHPYTLPHGGVKAKTGLHAVLAGAGAAYILFYR